MKRSLFFTALLGISTAVSGQLSVINENFDSFTASFPSFPQNGWAMSAPSTMMMIIAEEGINKYVQSYASSQVNVPHYLISPQIVAPDGTKTLSFEASKVVQSSFMGTVEAGLVTSPTDMASFTSLGAAVTLQTTTPQTLTYTVPASSQQYIAFKFIGLNSHASTRLDNVVYGTGNLSVNDSHQTSGISHYVDSQQLIFKGKLNITKVKIYDTAGRLFQASNSSKNTYNISLLKAGIYFFEAISEDGRILKSKFVKK